MKLCAFAVDGGLAKPGELGVLERDADGLPVLIRAAIENVPYEAVDGRTPMLLPLGGAKKVVQRWQDQGALELPVDMGHSSLWGEGLTGGAVGWFHPVAAPKELHFRILKWDPLGVVALTGKRPNGDAVERFRYSSPVWQYGDVAKNKMETIGGVHSLALTNNPATRGIKPLMPLSQQAGVRSYAMEISFNIPDDVAAKLPEGGVIAGLFGAMMLYALGDELYGVGAEGEPVKMGPMGGEVADMAEKGAMLAMSQKLANLERENAAVAKASALMASQLKALNAEKADRDLVAMSARVNDLALHGVPQPEILAFHERLKKGDDISVEVKAFERLPKRSTDAAPSVSNPGPALPTKDAYAAMSEQEKSVFLAGGVASVRHLQAIGALPSFGK